MPRLRRGVDVNRYELAELERALTPEQRYALIDAGWDDVAAAVDFAMRHLPEVRQSLAAMREQPHGDWGRALSEFAAWSFWDRAVPLLVEHPREPELPKQDVPPQPRGEQPPRSQRSRPAKRETTYGHPDEKYPSRQVADAVRRWRAGGEKPNVSEIGRHTGLSRPLIGRIGRLDGRGAFELGPRGGLRVLGTDGKFRAAGASVSIRALERAVRLP